MTNKLIIHLEAESHSKSINIQELYRYLEYHENLHLDSYCHTKHGWHLENIYRSHKELFRDNKRTVYDNTHTIIEISILAYNENDVINQLKHMLRKYHITEILFCKNIENE